MQANSLRKEFEDIALLPFARSSRGKKRSRCDFSLFAPVPEGGLAPLHCHSEWAFGNIVGRIDAWMPYEGKQALSLREEKASKCAHLAVGAVDVLFRQRKEFLLQRDRFLDELVTIEVAFAESMP